jgi:hypothetical protein
MRPVTSAELDAHLTPIREDVRQLVADQRAFAEFMTGAITSRTIQQSVMRSRHFWIGASTAMFAGLATAAGVIVAIAHG